MLHLLLTHNLFACQMGNAPHISCQTIVSIYHLLNFTIWQLTLNFIINFHPNMLSFGALNNELDAVWES